MTNISAIIDALKTALANDSFVRLTLGGFHGVDTGLKKIMVRTITVKGIRKLSFTYRYQTRDVVKNYGYDDACALIADALTADFKTARLMTTQYDLDFPSLRRGPPNETQKPATDHNRVKHRHVGTVGRPYLHALGITDRNGAVLPSSQDKYRQIDKYVEIVGGLVSRASKGSILNIADMGSGKGYLTFALYDFLRSSQPDIRMTGVEQRPDMVKLCDTLARESAFNGLSFIEGTIENFDAAGVDMLVALHACDTATDDAIAKGIGAAAEIIVVAPCCHKQIRRAMERGTPDAGLHFLLRHGSFLERQAEMVTDAVRVLVLEYFGYGVKAFEFISDVHTPKNIMIVAEKKNSGGNVAILEKIAAAKSMFGIETHYLEIATGLQSRQ